MFSGCGGDAKMSTEFIENLFYKQIKDMTKKTADSFDLQHSDAWLWGEIMIEEKEYNYYPEQIARIVLQHELIMPDEARDFASFVRGCCWCLGKENILIGGLTRTR